MKKILNIIQYVFPFQNKCKNVLLYLSLSPLINYSLTNIYYYNCGGYVASIYDFLGLVNPFNSCNYLCFLLSTLITMNLYIKSYIFYITMVFLLTLFI